MAQDYDGMAILREAASRVPVNSQCADRINETLQRHVHAGVHLGVFVEPFLEAILDGRKTVESRFGVHRRAPFEQVEPGDIILLKQSGGPIVGVALAGETKFYELGADDLGEIRKRYASQICAEDDEFWDARSEKRYATLIEIEEAIAIDALEIKKRDRRGWVTYAKGRQKCPVCTN